MANGTHFTIMDVVACVQAACDLKGMPSTEKEQIERIKHHCERLSIEDTFGKLDLLQALLSLNKN